ncbi:hypothetical protein [Henriciella litoralis]|uniref:hypothetical protein n=1 Tax=Henriciella litoralis TaxID=568102 RepID=UPI000A011195|nr:hypothetical protein [Henriciella litoralis]
MTMSDWIMLSMAGALGLGGLGALYLAWKRPGHALMLSAGWALLMGAVLVALVANGDRGVAQVSVVIMAGATALFAVPMFAGIAAPVPAARSRGRAPRRPMAGGHPVMAGLSGLCTFMITGPVAGIIALLASAGLFKLLRPADGSPATAGAIAIIAAVLLWAVISVLLLIEPRGWRRAVYAALALVAAALSAFI